uniref:Uncharacterized protein n=1 Tax=Rhizophora mucronata TaxID=61149 RepID=A0A2P2PY34_RHIMU
MRYRVLQIDDSSSVATKNILFFEVTHRCFFFFPLLPFLL